MVLLLLWLAGTALAAPDAAVWSGRPVETYAPKTTDAAGLSRFYDRSEGAGSVSLAAPRRGAGTVRFNGADFPAAAFPGRDSMTAQLVSAIDKTEASLDLMLYELNQEEVWQALQRAVARKPPVQVRVLVDSSHAYPYDRPASPQLVALLGDSRFKVRVQRGLDQYGTNHNKFAIFDGKMLEYGSYNWTNAAETKNFENALFTGDGARIGLYYSYYEWAWKNANEPGGPAPLPTLPGPPPFDPSPTVAFNGNLFPHAVFSPNGGSVAWVTKAIAASESSIDVAMFSFFEQSLGDALLERKNAGKKIRIVLDFAQAQRSPVAKFFRDHGFDVRVSRGRDGKQGVMHDKFAIFDRKLLETGSFNWTNNAEHNNFENASFVPEAGIVSEFQAEFERIWKQGVDPKTLPEDAGSDG
ncbi:MAG: hypothetical protein HY925_09105 [Elusimicrobia bacterium]|nr:hypothetical protein [Elusimicrobiota bacterium]